MNLFVGKRRRVLKCLTDIVWFQIRILRKNLVGGHAVSDKIHNQGNSDPHASNAGSAADYMWVKCDSLKHVVFLSVDPRGVNP
jgi:hypothetical protein